MTTAIRNNPSAPTTPAPTAPPATPTLAERALDVAREVYGLVPGIGDSGLGLVGSMDAFDGAADLVGLHDPVAGLAPGESITTTIEGKAGAEKYVGVGELEVKVERKAQGGYSIEVDAGAGAGVELDVKGLEGQATFTGGRKITLEAKTADEAREMLSLLRKEALVRGATGLATPAMGLGGFVADKLGLSSVEKATEVESRVGLKLAAELDATKVFHGAVAEGAALGLAFEGAADAAVRVVKNPDGTKSAVVEARATVSADVEAGVEGHLGPKLGMSKKAGREVELAVRTTYALPNDFDMADAGDPLAVLAALKGDGKTELAVTSKSIVGRTEVEAELVVKSAEEAAVVAAAALGDKAAAHQASGFDVKGEVTTSVGPSPTTFAVEGNKFEAGIETRRATTGKPVEVESVGAFLKTLAKAETLDTLKNQLIGR